MVKQERRRRRRRRQLATLSLAFCSREKSNSEKKWIQIEGRKFNRTKKKLLLLFSLHCAHANDLPRQASNNKIVTRPLFCSEDVDDDDDDDDTLRTPTWWRRRRKRCHLRRRRRQRESDADGNDHDGDDDVAITTSVPLFTIVNNDVDNSYDGLWRYILIYDVSFLA